MKKYSMFLAMAALVSAMSCSKEVDSPENVNTAVEKEVITVRLSSPSTKTALEGTKTVWLEGDKVSVTVGDKIIGELELVEEDIFKGEVEAGYDGEATLNYPAGVTAVPATQEAVAGTFADEAALLEGKMSMDDLRAGKNAELVNTTSLLQFSVAQSGDVTFEVGTAKYTVTGCKTGETYYACVAPASAVNFVARIDGYFSKQASSNVTFSANKIANIESLPAPTKSAWGVVGIGGNWDNDIAMYNDVDGYVVAKNVNIKSTDEFKLRKDGAWTTSIAGGITAPNTKREAGWVNMTISEAGTYDVYYKDNNYYIMTPGKLPADAAAPGPIVITVTYDGYTHLE